ncbi:MAG: lipopolysaccharide assembly LapA domain-containing protein [Azoarcus sp.]
MRALMWLLRLVLFFLLFGFAVKNDQLASLKFFFGSEWQLPIVFIIVIAFAAGALLGVTATFGSLLRQRREISRLRKQIERAKRERAESPVPVSEVQAPETL